MIISEGLSGPEKELVEEVEKSDVRRNIVFDPQQRPDSKDILRRHWHDATECARTEINADRMDDWFDRLWAMHTEPSRHYHTAVHLQEMLAYFDLVVRFQTNYREIPSFSEEQQSTIRLAIFFHDCIYDVKSSQNEEQSAELFERFAADVGMVDAQPGVVARVASFVRATQRHLVSPDNPPDLSLFLDLDMAVLGKDEAAYRAYAALIRHEYSFAPREVYCSKRAEILQAFLKQPRIYGTSFMRCALEAQARKNLQQEIVALRNGIIYGESTL